MKQIRIAVDNQVLTNQFKNRGKGVYLRNLLRELPEVVPEAGWVFPPFDQGLCDLFFQPDSDGGLRSFSCPQVVMFHDLTPLVLDRYSERGWIANLIKKRLYFDNLKKVQKASFFLANSDATKQDLVSFLGVSADKIGVTPLGIESNFANASQSLDRVVKQRQVRSRVGSDYILHVGGVEYNKNLQALIKAYAQVPQSLRRELKLVIVGSQLYEKKKPETRSILRLIKKLKLTERVVLPGFVASAELPFWYQAARVFVYPSLREGFGFPPLEAMASGTVAAVANTTSLPEVCGRAAYYFDPTDMGAIAQAILQCSNNEQLRATLIQKGRSQAGKFTWRKTAQITWRFFQTLL